MDTRFNDNGGRRDGRFDQELNHSIDDANVFRFELLGIFGTGREFFEKSHLQQVTKLVGNQLIVKERFEYL